MSEDFTQKEMLKSLISEVKEATKVLEKNSAKLESIEYQTIKTNGRVSRHDTRIESIEKKQESLITKVSVGAFAASAVFVGLLNKFY